MLPGFVMGDALRPLARESAVVRKLQPCQNGELRTSLLVRGRSRQQFQGVWQDVDDRL
jgi:hypothetical protein